jgi:CheY-like chemotaxis protein/HPt (histidine-containing phosphotransfer) domain-containing protein
MLRKRQQLARPFRAAARLAGALAGRLRARPKPLAEQHRLDFLSAVSHDIRTPLAGVLGMLQFALRDPSLRPQTQEYLRIGLENGDAMLAILNDILDYSKIDAGTLTLEKASFDLGQMARDTVTALRPNADAKGLLLRSEVGAGLPQFVLGDAFRVRQVLLNLIGNAIKFTEYGEVKLAMHLDPSGAIRFSVSDTGPGIEPAVRERLFKKFQLADYSTTRRHGGTGLGLAICKELVQMMHGTIEVEQRQGPGSCFTMVLPLPASNAPEENQLQQRPAQHAFRLRVLCAEDVRTNQIIIGTLLEEMGHQVTIVENGIEAVHALATSEYDVVLMDGRMPVMDGEQATMAIRAGGANGSAVRDRRVKIIALTANASRQDCARYLSAGMDGFIAKPIDETILYDQLQKVIEDLTAAGRQLPATVRRPCGDDELSALFGIAPEPPVAAAGRLQIVALPGMSSGSMARIAEAFMQEAPRRVASARTALASNDSDGAAAAFHALKGSAGYLSNPQLRNLAHRLEILAKAGAMGEITDLMPELDSTLEMTLTGLQASA